MSQESRILSSPLLPIPRILAQMSSLILSALLRPEVSMAGDIPQPQVEASPVQWMIWIEQAD